jgi:hypothetical protein
MRSGLHYRLLWLVMHLAMTVGAESTARAQVVFPSEVTAPVFDFVSPPNLHLNLGSSFLESSSPSPRPDRFPLFRMPCGFLANPVGLDSDDDDPAPDPASALLPPSPGEDRLQLALGQDNPFFDFRYRGDPGGVGYYRLQTQYQLLDSSKAGLCLGFRAVTPAGLDADGVARGPTIFSPALAWYQDLGGNLAIHGYIGKNLRASPGWTDNLEKSVHYGLAIQQPFPGLANTSNSGLHVFVEALGRQRSNPDLPDRPTSTFEVLPGLHWQMGDNWWLTGGLLFPMGTSRLETNLWQITCSWRF